jgi:hypothetical protein
MASYSLRLLIDIYDSALQHALLVFAAGVYEVSCLSSPRHAIREYDREGIARADTFLWPLLPRCCQCEMRCSRGISTCLALSPILELFLSLCLPWMTYEDYPRHFTYWSYFCPKIALSSRSSKGAITTLNHRRKSILVTSRELKSNSSRKPKTSNTNNRRKSKLPLSQSSENIEASSRLLRGSFSSRPLRLSG